MTCTTTTTIPHSLDFELDILAQSPSLKIYTQICLCYSLTDETSHSDIIQTLQNGLAILYKSFPWLAGQVIAEGAEGTNTGVFKIVSLEQTPQLAVKDLRQDSTVPSMDALRRADFPAHMLDESPICARRTLPGNPDEAHLVDTFPVFLVQANFIHGGLLLTFVGQHNTMDMTGQAQIINLFDKACRGEEFTEEELKTGNLARTDLIPFYGKDWKMGFELEQQIIVTDALTATTSEKDATKEPVVPLVPPQTLWSFVSFSSTSLAALKSLATQSLPSRSSFISTDDALTAFLWQSIMRARLPRLLPSSPPPPPSSSSSDVSPSHPTPPTISTSTTTDIMISKFARAIDVRKYMNVPITYPGLTQNMAYNSFPLTKLTSSPLSVIASALRSSLDAEDIIHRTRALATFVHGERNRNLVNFIAKMDLCVDIMLSSWVKVDCYYLDFGLKLAKPECVRRPKFAPFESLLYLMPKSREGEITAMICLREEDMERLKDDEEFVKYGRYIG